MAAAGALCRVCRQRAAEYTCPRCNARYCSVDCYKQHSERCTEGFYRDAAVAELRGITAGEDERQRMMEILQRLHQEEVEGSGGSSDEDEEGGSGEEGGGGLSEETLHRLITKMAAPGGGLDIGAEDLSPAELAAFHRALAAGELSGAVQPWDPWWLSEEAAQLELSAAGTPLVAAVVDERQQEGQQGDDSSSRSGAAERLAAAAAAGALPAPPSRPLPPLAALTKAAPSPLLRYQLLDLLYSYCHTLRLYNGDYSWEAAEAADALFALSGVLAAVAPAQAGAGGGGSTGGQSPAAGGGSAGNVDAAGVAPVLLGCMQRACQPPAGGREGRAFAVGVLSDVAAMLRLGRPVVLTALMDASRLVEEARQQLEGAGAGPGPSRTKQQHKELRRRLVAAERKLLFFLSWANEQPPEAYDLLAVAVAAEHQKHAAAVGSNGAASSQPGPAVGAPETAAAAAAAAAAARLRPSVEDAKPAVLIEEL